MSALSAPPRFFSRAWPLSFILMLALLLSNGVISYHAIKRLISNEDRVHSTLNTLNVIKATFSAIQDAETGERGYLLSGNSVYLEPYYMAVKDIHRLLDHLLQLESDLQTQRPRVYALIQLAQRKLAQMEQTITLRRQDQSAAALELFLSGEGEMLMQQMRSQVRELQATEYERLNQQRNEALNVQKQVILTLAFATLVGVLLAAAVYVLVGRSLKKQQQNAEKLALTNEELETIIADRTVALERNAVELQSSNRELQDFAFVASHDLQEPLRKIRSFGDRLAQKYAAQLGDGADYIHRMQSAAERMSRLIEDLLSFSRITSQPKSFQAVSLQAVLHDVLDDLSVAIEARGAKIVADPLPVVDADPTQMRQLLQNLLGNALKFVPADKHPEIRINTRIFVPQDDLHDEAWIELLIIDNGVGFDEQYADRIFSPFQRLHGRNEYPGTGIGLSICRRIVEHHHGAILALSVPGEGATFVVRLPLKQEDVTSIHCDTGPQDVYK